MSRSVANPLLPQPGILRPKLQRVRGVLQGRRSPPEFRGRPGRVFGGHTMAADGHQDLGGAPRRRQGLQGTRDQLIRQRRPLPPWGAGCASRRSVVPPQVALATAAALQDAPPPGALFLPVPGPDRFHVHHVERPPAAPPAGISPREAHRGLREFGSAQSAPAPFCRKANRGPPLHPSTSGWRTGTSPLRA